MKKASAQSFKQFDKQVDKTTALAWLNELYLACEQRTNNLDTITERWLRWLVTKAYPNNKLMQEWWNQELAELPGWNNV